MVITIRQTSVVPAKNCNMEIWLGAAERIQVAGHRVVLVPDTDMESRPLPSGFEWCREAATSVSLRAGLYQNAMCSLSMGIGPMATAMFMPSTRYAMFVNHRSGGTTQRQLFERVFGVRWGQQLPFAGAGQVIEYREDDEDAILDAFHRSISGRQAA